MCLVGVVVRRYIDFLIHVLLIPTPLVSALFCLLFVHKKNVFRSLKMWCCNFIKGVKLWRSNIILPLINKLHSG